MLELMKSNFSTSNLLFFGALIFYASFNPTAYSQESAKQLTGRGFGGLESVGGASTPVGIIKFKTTSTSAETKIIQLTPDSELKKVPDGWKVGANSFFYRKPANQAKFTAPNSLELYLNSSYPFETLKFNSFQIGFETSNVIPVCSVSAKFNGVVNGYDGIKYPMVVYTNIDDVNFTGKTINIDSNLITANPWDRLKNLYYFNESNIWKYSKTDSARRIVYQTSFNLDNGRFIDLYMRSNVDIEQVQIKFKKFGGLLNQVIKIKTFQVLPVDGWGKKIRIDLSKPLNTSGNNSVLLPLNHLIKKGAVNVREISIDFNSQDFGNNDFPINKVVFSEDVTLLDSKNIMKGFGQQVDEYSLNALNSLGNFLITGAQLQISPLGKEFCSSRLKTVGFLHKYIAPIPLYANHIFQLNRDYGGPFLDGNLEEGFIEGIKFHHSYFFPNISTDDLRIRDNKLKSLEVPFSGEIRFPPDSFIILRAKVAGEKIQFAKLQIGMSDGRLLNKNLQFNVPSSFSGVENGSIIKKININFDSHEDLINALPGAELSIFSPAKMSFKETIFVDFPIRDSSDLLVQLDPLTKGLDGVIVQGNVIRGLLPEQGLLLKTLPINPLKFSSLNISLNSTEDKKNMICCYLELIFDWERGKTFKSLLLESGRQEYHINSLVYRSGENLGLLKSIFWRLTPKNKVGSYLDTQFELKVGLTGYRNQSAYEQVSQFPIFLLKGQSIYPDKKKLREFLKLGGAIQSTLPIGSDFENEVVGNLSLVEDLPNPVYELISLGFLGLDFKKEPFSFKALELSGPAKHSTKKTLEKIFIGLGVAILLIVLLTLNKNKKRFQSVLEKIKFVIGLVYRKFKFNDEMALIGTFLITCSMYFLLNKGYIAQNYLQSIPALSMVILIKKAIGHMRIKMLMGNSQFRRGDQTSQDRPYLLVSLLCIACTAFFSIIKSDFWAEQFAVATYLALVIGLYQEVSFIRRSK